MLLSVRLITYNHEDFIEQALRGIEDQITDFNFEVIIGDDFSTDNNLNIIKNYKFTNKNITVNILNREIGDEYWITRQKLGRLYNFVNILENCKGKYIALLDGDDFWTDPYKLQKQVDFLEANEDYTGSFHDTLTINEKDNYLTPKPFRVYEKIIFNLEDTISTISLFHISSFVFRQSLLEIPVWFTKVQSGDMALFAMIASNGPLYRIDAAMSMYRKNVGGITNAITIKSYHKNRIKLFKYLKSFCSSDFKTNIDQVINFHKNELKIIFQSSIKNRIKRFLKF
jgi:glycosyltransferase involved in cell wall biosynthesis